MGTHHFIGLEHVILIFLSFFILDDSIQLSRDREKDMKVMRIIIDFYYLYFVFKHLAHYSLIMEFRPWFTTLAMDFPSAFGS